MNKNLFHHNNNNSNDNKNNNYYNTCINTVVAIIIAYLYPVMQIGHVIYSLSSLYISNPDVFVPQYNMINTFSIYWKGSIEIN